MSFRCSDPATLEVRHRHEVLTILGADSVRVCAARYRIPAESHGHWTSRRPAARSR